MKHFRGLIFVFSLLGQQVLAMGDRSVIPRNLSSEESRAVNDMEETTSLINLFADERGYKDQQMMEEDPRLIEAKIEETKMREKELEKKNEIRRDKHLPRQEIRIYHH